MPPPNGLGLPSKLTRWIVLQKARRHTRRCSDSLYAHNFRIYFIPLSGVLFTFPSRYLYTIDRKTYLALEGGPSGFRQGFTCPVLLDTPQDKSHGLVITRFPTLRIPGSHSLWRSFPEPSARLGNFLPCAGYWQNLLLVRNTGLLQGSVLVNYLSQPLVNIRLPTYPSKLTDGS
jgi:hypothetical protein